MKQLLYSEASECVTPLWYELFDKELVNKEYDISNISSNQSIKQEGRFSCSQLAYGGACYSNDPYILLLTNSFAV